MAVSTRFWRLTSLANAASAIPMALLAALFVADVLALSAESWRIFLGLVGAIAVPTFAVTARLQRARLEPLLRWLEDAPGSTPRAALAAALGYQREAFFVSPASWLAGSVLLCAISAFWLTDFGAFECIATLVSALGFSLVAGCLSHFIFRSLARPYWNRAAAAVPLAERIGATRAISLGRKLQVGFLAIGAVPLLLCLIVVATHAPAGSMIPVRVAVVSLVAGGLGLVLAHLIASDITTRIESLGRGLERVAAGDLRRIAVVESDDEIAELARSSERMAHALRDAVGRMNGSARGIDGSLQQLERAGERVEAGSSSQHEQIASARKAFAEIERDADAIRQRSLELGRVAEAAGSSATELGASGTSLHEIAEALFGRLDQTAAALAQLARSAEQIAGSAAALAASATETDAAMRGLVHSASEIDAQAAETGRLAGAVEDVCEAGRVTMRRSDEGMRRVQKAVASSEAAMAGFRESVGQIGGVVEIIREIGDQTHMLALNASITAAQAGEHGRPFSVVADHVKELAERVTQRAGEIDKIIEAIDAGTGDVGGAMAESRLAVETGLERSQEATQALDDIARRAAESGTCVASILAAIAGHNEASRSIQAQLDAVSEASGVIAASASEQNGVHREISEVVASVRDIAGHMRTSAEQQADESARLRDGVRSLEVAIQVIHRALESQSHASQGCIGMLEEVQQISQTNLAAADALGGAVETLRGRAQSLDAAVSAFSLEERPA